jgi:hypothetical protein
MKRRICSYDMVEGPNESYVVTDDVGEVYLCNPRCLCIWAVLLATRPSLDEMIKNQRLRLRLPSMEEQSFEDISKLALWAAAHALHRDES